jgi:hypothetical protein
LGTSSEQPLNLLSTHSEPIPLNPFPLTRRDLLKLTAAAAVAGPSAPQPPTSPEPLRTRGLFLHVWDLEDEGVDRVLGWTRDAGLNQMLFAGSYHSGWFVHPGKPKRRLYMTQGGVLYFPPDPAIFKSTPIQPEVADFVRKTNWLRRAGDQVDKYGLRMASWTIGVHSTKLGLKYPQYTQHTAYGDSLPHALSIGHDAVRAYLKAICRDLATNYPMYGVQLEAFGWMGASHGHHHERDLTGLSPLEGTLLSICFNPQTMEKAKAKGVDAGRAREAVRSVLDAAFREAPDRPAGHPASIAEVEERFPALKAYNQVRRQLASDLIVEIKQEALRGTTCRLLLQSGYDPAVAHVVDGFACGAYGQPPEKVLEIVRAATAKAPGWKGDFPCFIRLGMGVPSSAEQLRAIVTAVKQGGSTGPIFYNYSESPPKMLAWVKGALEGL